jgi:hypothetical protein
MQALLGTRSGLRRLAPQDFGSPGSRPLSRREAGCVVTIASLGIEQGQLLAQGEKTLSQRDKQILAARQSVAAQLASAMIISSGRPHNLAEATQIYTDVLYTLFPQQGQEKYEEWSHKRLRSAA